MTKQLLITAFIAIFLCANVANAQKQTSTKINEVADKMVNKLNANVALSEKQKRDVLQKTKNYLEKLQTASDLKDKTQTSEIQKRACDLYNAALDSILTNEQKIKHIAKANERREAIQNKNNK